jgi:protein DJ-1
VCPILQTVLGGLAGFSCVECSRGVKLFPDAILAHAWTAGPYDIVIIPGGIHGAETLAASQQVGDILKEQESKKGLIAAICAGPLVLDRHDIGKGTLAQRSDGEKLTTVTSHPSVKDRLEDYHYR